VIARRHLLAVARGRGDREANLDFTRLELPADVEARVLEHVEHMAVLREHLCDELLDPDLARGGGELLEEACADTAALIRVVDRERDLGRAAVAQAHVVRQCDDVLAERPDEGAALVPVGIEHGIDEVRAEGREAVEAEVAAPIGELLEEVEEGGRIVGGGRPQPQRRAVAQDHIGCVASCHAAIIAPGRFSGIPGSPRPRRGFPAEPSLRPA
jgi:hypothetical protein